MAKTKPKTKKKSSYKAGEFVRAEDRTKSNTATPAQRKKALLDRTKKEMRAYDKTGATSSERGWAKEMGIKPDPSEPRTNPSEGGIKAHKQRQVFQRQQKFIDGVGGTPGPKGPFSRISPTEAVGKIAKKVGGKLLKRGATAVSGIGAGLAAAMTVADLVEIANDPDVSNALSGLMGKNTDRDNSRAYNDTGPPPADQRQAKMLQDLKRPRPIKTSGQPSDLLYNKPQAQRSDPGINPSVRPTVNREPPGEKLLSPDSFRPTGASSKPTGGVQTKGGFYPTYSRNSQEAQSFRETFDNAVKTGQTQFSWQGRMYTNEIKGK